MIDENVIAARTLEQLLRHLRRKSWGVLADARARRYYRSRRERLGIKRRRAERRREKAQLGVHLREKAQGGNDL